MPQLYANPYNTSATGFYFESLDEFKKKAKASRVEEFEIDFIDGDEIDQMLFRAMSVTQGTLDEYWDAIAHTDDDDAIRLAILMEDMGYDYEDAQDRREDLIVYGGFDSDEDFAYEYVESIGSLEDALGKNIQNYFDYEAFGRDLRISGDLYDPDDPDAEERYEDMSDQEIGEEVADSLGWEAVGKRNLEMYFDWGTFARDLMFDMSEYNGIYYDPRSV
jgi:antirestriction protein